MLRFVVLGFEERLERKTEVSELFPGKLCVSKIRWRAYPNLFF